LNKTHTSTVKVVTVTSNLKKNMFPFVYEMSQCHCILTLKQCFKNKSTSHLLLLLFEGTVPQGPPWSLRDSSSQNLCSCSGGREQTAGRTAVVCATWKHNNTSHSSPRWVFMPA